MSDSSDHSLNTHEELKDESKPWKIVFDNVANGTPDEPTRAGFLALARLGKTVWNAWRNAYPCEINISVLGEISSSGPLVDLTGYDFSENINFAGFQFGDGANFEGVCFSKWAVFEGAQFGVRANFNFTRFEDYTVFLGAQFDEDAKFTGAKFKGQTTFEGGQFDCHACFRGAQFLCSVIDFKGVQFGDFASFSCAIFESYAEFDGDSWAGLGYSVYGENLDDRRVWAESRNLDPKKFGRISFGGAQFLGGAGFSNRCFTRAANFGLTNEYSTTLHFLRDSHGKIVPGKIIEEVKITKDQPTFFKYPPEFHNSILHQDTTFNGAIFPKKAHGNEMCARAYRTLKLAFAQQHAVREEQRFFKLEMAEEAELDAGAKQWLYHIYKEVSDYGFSLIRPLVWGLVLTGLFAVIYGLLMWGSDQSAGLAFLTNAQYNHHLTIQWLQFTLLNLFPLPGFNDTLQELRDNLFGDSGWWPLLAIIVEVLHKICILLAIFLIGLALRNLFKLK